MAYKPKYAQTKASPGKPAMGQTQPNREEPGQKPKKMGRGRCFLGYPGALCVWFGFQCICNPSGS